MSTAPNYGNCYTFNAAYNADDEDAPRASSLTGATNGESSPQELPDLEKAETAQPTVNTQRRFKYSTGKKSLHITEKKEAFDVCIFVNKFQSPQDPSTSAAIHMAKITVAKAHLTALVKVKEENLTFAKFEV